MTEPSLSIVNRPEASRYEARLSEAVAGFVEYRMAGARRILLHTEVPPAYAGRGIGASLARHILEEALADGTRLTVRCPFIRAYIERHPAYSGVVTGERHAGPVDG